MSGWGVLIIRTVCNNKKGSIKWRNYSIQCRVSIILRSNVTLSPPSGAQPEAVTDTDSKKKLVIRNPKGRQATSDRTVQSA